MSGRIEDRIRELHQLPEVEPPGALEAMTLAAMARETAAVPERRRWRGLARAAAIVAAAGVGLLLANLGGRDDGVDDVVQQAALFDDTYFELVEESARLDELLTLLPEPRRVMRAGTASTIVGLEDQVALIDAALSGAVPEATAPEYRNALLRDRVEVMNALVHVRYSQSRAFTY